MTCRLDGHTILITGAGSGIGRAIALRASAEGAALGLIDIDESALNSTVSTASARGGRITTRLADVSDRVAIASAIDSVAEEIGTLDGVVANAAVLPPPVPVDAMDWHEWDRVLSINLSGAVHTLIASLSHVEAGASLLAIGSSMAIRPREHRLAYVAAKAGLHAATRALAVEIAPRQIRVNVIAPGLTDTPMVHAIAGHIASGLTSVPLGEMVSAEEVAALAVHLMSDEARHTTGAVFSVDGGRTAS